MVKGWKKNKLFEDGFAYITIKGDKHILLSENQFNKGKLKGKYDVSIWRSNPYRSIMKNVS